MIDFTETFPMKHQFVEIDVKDEVMNLYNQYIKSFEHIEEIAPNKAILKNEKIRDQENFRDGNGFIVTYDDTINLYPFFKEGWDLAINGDFTYVNNAYKFQEIIKEQIQKKYETTDLPYKYFEKLSYVAIEEAIEGMARYLYYVWLISIDKESVCAKPEFLIEYDNNQLELLHKSLEQQKYISIDLKSWKYWFCDEQCDNPQKIKWILLNRKGSPHKTALREFLMMLCKTSSLDKIVKTVFVDSKGKSIQLAKPKADEYSNYYTTTQEMFDKLANK